MRVAMSVCPFVCQSVIIDQKPVVTCVLPVGNNKDVFLEAQVSRKFMNYIPAFWLSTPNATQNLPTKPTLGNFQKVPHNHTYF